MKVVPQIYVDDIVHDKYKKTEKTHKEIYEKGIEVFLKEKEIEEKEEKK